MSRALRLGALGAGLLSAVAAEGQDLPTLERQMDALHAVTISHQQRLARYEDSLTALARRLDTVRVGPLVILAEGPLAELANAAGRLAADSLATVIGAAVNRLAGHAFVVRADRPERWEREDMLRRGLDSTVTVSVLYPGGHERRTWRGRRASEELGGAMIHHALAVLYLDLDRGFAMWLGNQMPNDSVATMNWLTLRLNLASAIPLVSTRCFEGDIGSCKAALGLTDVTDPVTEWFDAARRRKAVEFQVRLAKRIDPVGTARCLDQRADSACASVLRMMQLERLPAATSGDARATLVRLALDRGGPDAVDRLLAEGTPLQRIERASGVPIDTIVAEWQRRVANARASSRDVSGEIVLASMMWIGVLLFASTRSSRWR